MDSTKHRNANIFNIIYLILICSVFAYAIILAIKPVICFDIYYYLEAGRSFYANGHKFFTKDPYLFTLSDAPAEVGHEWASILIIYLLYLLGSWNALLLAKITVILITISTPIILARQLKYRSPLVALITALSVYTFSFRFYLRTDLISTMLAMIVLLFILLLRENNYRFKKIFLILPFYFLLWVNLHPGFHLGLFLIGLALIIDGYSYLSGRNTQFKKDFLKFCTLYIFSIFSCFINPKGIYGFFFPIQLAMSKDMAVLRQFIPEWHPTLFYTNFIHIRFFLIILLLCLILTSIHLVKSYRSRDGEKEIPLYEIFIFLFFLYFGLASRRYIGISTLAFTLLSVFIAAKQNYFSIQEHWSRKQQGFVILLLLIISLIAFDKAYNIPRLEIEHNGSFHTSNSPENLAAFIESKEYDASKIYNHMRFGSYFAWKWQGERKVFIHSFVMDSDFFEKDYISAQLTKEGFDHVMDKYDIQVIILPPHILRIFEIGNILKNSPDWRPAYIDPLAVVYERI